jgi:hypothetical protein
MATIGPREAQLRAMRERQAAEREKRAKASPALINTLQSDVNKIAAKPSRRTRNAADQAKWREANPDTNRERARTGMRKKRSAEKQP